MIRTLLALLLLATTEAAAATTVMLQRDGQSVPNGQVCWFRAGDRENPFHRWLVSQDVKCVAAGTELGFPRGVWNVFARANNAVSIEPMLLEGENAPARIVMRLGAAATVVPLLPEKHRGVIYVPKRGSAFPAEERTTVPADEELWLIVLEKARPVAVLTIPALAAGTERTVDARGGSPAWAVLGWLRVPEEDRNALANATGLVSPGVRAVADVATRDADPLPSLSLLHGAFVRVREVPPGNAELRLEGSGWVPNRRGVKVDGTVSIADQPLIVRAAATLVVHWSTEADLAALERSLGGCRDSHGPEPLLQIQVSRCVPQRPGTPPDPESCTMIKEETFDPRMRFDDVTLEDLTPGAYRAELRFGKLPPVTGTTTVAPLRPAEIRLHASYYQVHGSVTRGGEPLGEDVGIQFPSGPGFAPAESEDYHAVLRGMLGVDARITVAACDGSPRTIVLSDEPMMPSRRFNIDIPANRLTIQVADTFTGEPLRGAKVRFQVMSLRFPKRPVLEGTLTTNEEGIAVMESVPIREVHLAVSYSGYQKKPIEPFSMTKTEKKSIDVQLVPLRGTHGKIVSDRPFDRGMVFWFAPSGSETERVDLSEDGTFVYMGAHPPEETMAVVSQSHPLWVLRSPAVERRQAIHLRFPTAPVRAFTAAVVTGYVSSWYIGLEIGGVRVPHPALTLHQSLRRDPTTVRAGVNMRIQDILATGPIDVILGPTTDEVTGPARGMDFYALPKFADRPKQRLAPDATLVMFEVRVE